MPIFMKYDGIDGDIYDYSSLPPSDLDPSRWQPYPGATSLAALLRKQHPLGVDSILIGLLRVPGFRLLRPGRRTGGVHVATGDVNGDGIIAILIGLLLPAVQKIRAAASSERQGLSGALKTGGQLAVAMGDGSVRLVTSTGPGGGPHSGIMPTNGGVWQFLQTGIVSPRDVASGLPTGRQHC